MALPPSPSPPQAHWNTRTIYGEAAQTCTYCLLLFPNLLTVADIIRWGFYCFSAYSSGALNLPCVFTAVTRSRRDGSVTTIVPFPPNTARSPLYCLSTAGDRANESPSTVNAGRSQRNSKRTQPQSHSPAPLRTPLRLSPREESPDRCHDLVHVRYRAATTTLHSHRVDTSRALAVRRRPEVWR